MPEVGFPSYVKVQPDGGVLLDWPGHVSAQGVDLKAGDSSSPPADRRVRWLRESDGSMVADLRAYANADAVTPQAFSALTTKGPASNWNVSTRLAAEGADSTGPKVAQFTAQVSPTSGSGLFAQTQNDYAVVLDDQGGTDFLRILGSTRRNLRATFGTSSAQIGDGVSGTSPTFTHGLNTSYRYFFATAMIDSSNGRNDFLVDYGYADAGTVYFMVRAAAGEQYPLPFGYVVNFFWLAIGHD